MLRRVPVNRESPQRSHPSHSINKIRSRLKTYSKANLSTVKLGVISRHREGLKSQRGSPNNHTKKHTAKGKGKIQERPEEREK